MALIDKLRKAIADDKLAPSDVPTVSEVLNLLGAAIAYAEQGEKLFEKVEDAAKPSDPSPVVPPVVPAAPVPPPADAIAAEPVAPAPAPDATAPADPVAPAPSLDAAQSRDDQIAMLTKQIEQAQTALAALQHGEASDSEAAV